MIQGIPRYLIQVPLTILVPRVTRVLLVMEEAAGEIVEAAVATSRLPPQSKGGLA
jgi:hypothetical protein